MRPDTAARTWLTWALAFGVNRAAIRLAARYGDLIGRLELEPRLREDPYPSYDEIRNAGPVLRGRGISATADHGTATAILRSDAFGVAGGHAELPAPVRRLLDKVRDPAALGPVDPPSMLAVDPPEHNRYRTLVSKAFTARSVAALEPRIRARAEALLDEMAPDAGNGLDLVERYAALLPVAVIADILGVPEDMHRRLLAWGNGAALTLDPALTFRQDRGAARDVRHLHAWFGEHVAALRQCPEKEGSDNLLARLAHTEGDRLTDEESVGHGAARPRCRLRDHGQPDRQRRAQLLDRYPRQRKAVPRRTRHCGPALSRRSFGSSPRSSSPCARPTATPTWVCPCGLARQCW